MNSNAKSAHGWTVGERRDRRRLRRAETIEEILDAAVAVMSEEGVAALSLSEVARRIGIRPPSLYKYFPSRLALYDALFQRGAEQVRDVFRTAVSEREPGWETLRTATLALVRWGVEYSQVLPQLLFWRPVPGFQPSPQALAPSLEFIADVRSLLRAAVDRGELHSNATSEEAAALWSVLVTGVPSQHFANEPDASWDEGRFTRLAPRILDLFLCAYPPKEGRT